MIRVQDNVYELVEEHKEGFKPDVFKERYSDILSKFDYILGDWGYGQLRLKGFFEDTNRKAPYDARLSFLDEYILEYCNFGCSYFLLKKTKSGSAQPIESEIVEAEGETGDGEEERPSRSGREGGRRRDSRRRSRPRRKPKDGQARESRPDVPNA
ncbi:uncharacterized protein YutD [Aneurinibacillus soli]|uniref:Uncharacterized protein n=1 Tax=Aneurinibacillus soli TaxID=1500254 RepID=A0A0U5AXW0_9BACL|nr:YutD family protein [Aneurinibacillus soli]PYE60927.1 uncharacterized protein YutD [Aneurinibacillus soli]BAU26832.1 hypothetical protein CB4_01001 [Aneurinibacillus soli]